MKTSRKKNSRLSALVTRTLIRPTVYKTFSRFIYGLVVTLLWERFVSDGLITRMHGFIFMSAFFAVMAWICYLKLDGVSIPKKPEWLDSISRKPVRSYGDIADHVDEQVVTFEDLEEDEKTVCILIADLICCALFGLLSLV